MILKKSTITACSSSSLPSITSPCPGRSRHFGTPRRGRNPRIRTHVTTSREPREADGNANKGSSGEKHITWPSSPNPSPYEIFGQTRHCPYSKSRYYDLVKKYHPDRHHLSSHDGIPHPTKLERYRLVVAANDILSDPARRRQYDLYGAGWAGKADLTGNPRTQDRSWRERPGNPSMNATWEDWERWYQEQNGEKQNTVFMSNGGFAALIFLFVLAAAWGQMTRAGQYGMTLVEMREERHGAINRELWKKQIENAQLTRQGRVEEFLRQREGWGFDEPVYRTGGGTRPAEKQHDK